MGLKSLNNFGVAEMVLRRAKHLYYFIIGCCVASGFRLAVIPGRAAWREPGIHFTARCVARWILRCAIAHHSSRLRRAPE
jgi:hypothetical protein